MEMEKYHYNIKEKETTNNGDYYNKKNNENLKTETIKLNNEFSEENNVNKII